MVWGMVGGGEMSICEVVVEGSEGSGEANRSHQKKKNKGINRQATTTGLFGQNCKTKLFCCKTRLPKRECLVSQR